MELSQFLSWVGTGTGMLIGIPQLIKTIQTKQAGVYLLQRMFNFSHMLPLLGTDDRHQGNGNDLLLLFPRCRQFHTIVPDLEI